MLFSLKVEDATNILNGSLRFVMKTLRYHFIIFIIFLNEHHTQIYMRLVRATLDFLLIF